MKAIALIALAIALEAGFLLSISLPAGAELAGQSAAAKVEVARAPAAAPARS